MTISRNWEVPSGSITTWLIFYCRFSNSSPRVHYFNGLSGGAIGWPGRSLECGQVTHFLFFYFSSSSYLFWSYGAVTMAVRETYTPQVLLYFCHIALLYLFFYILSYFIIHAFLLFFLCPLLSTTFPRNSFLFRRVLNWAMDGDLLW